MDVNFKYFLDRKYNQLQQQADATTQNAASNAIAAQAGARLDNTRAALLPGESAAGIRKMDAETGLIGQQAKYFGPEALARIAQMKADTAYTGTQNRIAIREGLDERRASQSAIDRIIQSRGGYQGFQLSY